MIADQLTAAVQAARSAGRGPFSKESSVVTRLPISGDIVCNLASEDYDPRDVLSHSAAERRGRQQAWAYLDVHPQPSGLRQRLPRLDRPEFGTRESRHIEAVHRLAWQDVVERRSVPDSIALGAWGVEWHDRATLQSSFAHPTGQDSL